MLRIWNRYNAEKSGYIQYKCQTMHIWHKTVYCLKTKGLWKLQVFFICSIHVSMLIYFTLVAMQLRTWRQHANNNEAVVHKCFISALFFTENYLQEAEVLIPPTKLIFKHSHFTTLTKIWNFSNISLYWDDVNMTSNWLQCIKENEISIKIH